ncbi:MAG: LuxR C-terminal-related transcriptional regulator, partial [Oscillospiraceae bacterium]|nr:LuxR C-terminal-related transcriptional regulator [Oscillospiraceae bacterium]
VLISRSQLPPWLLPSYIQHGFMVIGEDSLRLTEDEIAAYLDEQGVPCGPDTVRNLWGIAQGNAYAIRHTVLRLREGANPGPELVREIESAFMNYLESSVMIQWDSELLEFLMELSVVDEFTLELAETVSGSRHVLALLDRAAEAGNFLRQEGGVYRLRPILVRALWDRAGKVFGTARMKDLAAKAGLYYELRDEIAPALKMYEYSGSEDRIRQLLIRNARRNPGNGHYYELRQYYFRMDEKEIESSPVLMAGMSMLYSMLMDGEKSEYWYEKLNAFSKTAQGGERREALSRLTYLDIGLPHRGSRDLLKIMKRVPSLLFDKGLGLPEFSVTSNLPSTMNGGKDFCEWSKQDEKIAATMGPLVTRVLGRYGKGLLKAALGESLYEKGEDTYRVLTLLARAQMEAERDGVPEIAFAAVGVRIRLALGQGELFAAKELLASFEASVREQRAMQLLPNIQAMRCRLALYENDRETVNRWLASAPDGEKEFCSLERYRYLTKVRCHIADGKYLAALGLLEKLRYYAEQTGRPYIRMETGLLSAIAKERMGGPWREDMYTVIQEAGEYRFLRLISEEGAAAWPLLQQMKEELLADETLDKEWLGCLLNEAEEMSRRYPHYLERQTAAMADFSETALEILRLQAKGLSKNQIASQLHMKPDNVGYHIRENYRKLGASNKTEAMLTARGLGLI